MDNLALSYAVGRPPSLRRLLWWRSSAAILAPEVGSTGCRTSGKAARPPDIITFNDKIMGQSVFVEMIYT